MTAPNYTDWIANNPTLNGDMPDGVKGRRLEVDWLTTHGKFIREVLPAEEVEWADPLVLRYRFLIEPVRGEIVLTGDNHPQCGWAFGPVPLPSDTHRLTIPTLDGALVPGEYTGPGGVITVTEVR